MPVSAHLTKGSVLYNKRSAKFSLGKVRAIETIVARIHKCLQCTRKRLDAEPTLSNVRQVEMARVSILG